MSRDVGPGAPRDQQAVEWDIPDSEQDELLVEETRPPWLGTPRRRGAAIAALIALLGTLIGLRLASTTDNDKQAAPLPSAARQPTIGPSPVDITPGRPQYNRDDPAHCPDWITCRSLPSVPPSVLAAISKYLPQAAIESRTSVVQLRPSRLYFRQVNASADDVSVIVLVSRADRSQVQPTEGTDDPVGAAIGYVRVQTSDGYVVQVQFTGQTGWTPPMGAIRALAGDPRLRALA
jgi:hypothetical protein